MHFDNLPEVLPRARPLLPATTWLIVLPARKSEAVTWGIYTLTSTVTAVTAAFHVQDEHVRRASAHHQPATYPPAPSASLTVGGRIRTVGLQKQAGTGANGANPCAATPRDGRRPPSRLIPQPDPRPAADNRADPHDRNCAHGNQLPVPRLKGDWTELLDLEDWEGCWQCTDLPWLRLHERKISGRGGLPLPLQDVLTLAALWGDLPGILTAAAEDLAVTIRPDEDEVRTQDGAIFSSTSVSSR